MVLDHNLEPVLVWLRLKHIYNFVWVHQNNVEVCKNLTIFSFPEFVLVASDLINKCKLKESSCKYCEHITIEKLGVNLYSV